MNQICFASLEDIDALSKLDHHISYIALKESIQYKRFFVLKLEDAIIGWLRYNLFWDNTPFMNMLYILEPYRNQGYGTSLLKYWEEQMILKGYTTLMTSTLVHEQAIHFYMKYGYKVVGGFYLSDEYETILSKERK